ncbi:MAG: O-antigen ligase family protein [Acidobacteria bacterium]|nr:O-antigen ligase family protein [Acidobacteriota bacterium]
MIESTKAAADPLERIGLLALFGVAGGLQFSIAAAQMFLAVAALAWVLMLATGRARFAAPRFFWPLAAYGALTLAAAAFSPDPAASFIDSRQLALFLLVPITYTFAAGPHGSTAMTVILTCAAVSAALGIVQYGILHYDNLGRRPQGTLGHYMTYSGLLMLVICVALARILFGRGERTWAALVMPALAVAVALSFGRSAMVGACVAAALLLALKDFRLVAILPVVAAVAFAVAPGAIAARYASIFDVKDPTRLDRIAMLHAGRRMIADHPLLGVGPNMVQRTYPAYRDPDARLNPHLHNVPVQIAAERGIPALLAWIWFIGLVLVDAGRRFFRGEHRFEAAAALAASAAMLSAGLFEYNFGDSEFLMLYLIIVTLPFAVERAAPRPA